MTETVANVIQWADDAMLKRVCEWLYEHLYTRRDEHNPSNHFVCSKEEMLTQTEFVEQLKKGNVMKNNIIYKIGDKFTKKNSQDSMIIEVKNIYYVTDNSDPTYVMKRLYPTVLDETFCISESVLIELYNKVNI